MEFIHILIQLLVTVHIISSLDIQESLQEIKRMSRSGEAIHLAPEFTAYQPQDNWKSGLKQLHTSSQSSSLRWNDSENRSPRRVSKKHHNHTHSENRPRHRLNQQNTVKIQIHSDCTAEYLNPWLRNSNLLNVHFSLQNVPSYKYLLNATVTVKFKGIPSRRFEKESLALMLHMNKRRKGVRNLFMFFYDVVQSTQDVSLTVDLREQVMRWLRNPMKNKGISLELQHIKSGALINATRFIRFPDYCTDKQDALTTDPENEKLNRLQTQLSKERIIPSIFSAKASSQHRADIGHPITLTLHYRRRTT